MPEEITFSELESLGRLDKDLRKAADTLTEEHARFLVDAYYQIQEQRKRAANQIRFMEDAEPHKLIDLYLHIFKMTEKSIPPSLARFCRKSAIGRWSLAQYGIGPTFTAALIAYFDINRAPTVGHFWRFAGLDPTVKWLGTKSASKLVRDVMGKETKVTNTHLIEISKRVNKKTKNIVKLMGDTMTKDSLIKALSRRPWHGRLKKICYLIGESFKKFHNSPKCFYGRIYLERKMYEIDRNESGELSGQARQTLKNRNIGKMTDAYKWYAGRVTPEASKKFREEKSTAANPATVKVELVKEGRGVPMLPPARIDLRAARYATKLFLCHLHQVWFFTEKGKLPPKPWILTQEGHVHEIRPPKMKEVPGLKEAFDNDDRVAAA